MNKKGFTLVELLAILVVLGIVILVAMPTLVESNRVAKINEKKDFEDKINIACETYKAVNQTATNVTIKVLAQEGYLKNGITAPDGTKVEDMTTNITITNAGCNYTYTN